MSWVMLPHMSHDFALSYSKNSLVKMLDIMLTTLSLKRIYNV